MRKEDLPIYAHQVLKDYLNKSGSILYSSHETLRPSDIYLLGFNPGGNPEECPDIISDEIAQLCTKTSNAYTAYNWKNESCNYEEKGELAPLQKRIKWIFERLDHNIEDICASNLIFLRSRDQTSLSSWWDKAKTCWKLHEKILEIVKPKTIMVFGNGDISPYSFIKDRYTLGLKDEHVYDSGHGNWKIKLHYTRISSRKVLVVGFPHFSRYDPTAKPQINPIIDLIKATLSEE